jgi:hypothetical protein
MRYEFENRPNQCPVCGGDHLAIFVYGYLDEIDCAAIDRGDIILGGCSIDDYSPNWMCNNCNLFMYSK